MKTFFLSAGVPMRSRHPKYFETADVVAIRDSLRGFIGAVLETSRVVFGGQEAITPMFRLMALEMGLSVRDHVILYQSEYFRKDFPPDNAAFEKVVLIPSLGNREESLAELRNRMLTDFKYDAGVFIGGMEGIEEEWNLFKRLQPNVPAFPIASTGAAAKIIFDSEVTLPQDLNNNLAYLHLFRNHLKIEQNI